MASAIKSGAVQDRNIPARNLRLSPVYPVLKKTSSDRFGGEMMSKCVLRLCGQTNKDRIEPSNRCEAKQGSCKAWQAVQSLAPSRLYKLCRDLVRDSRS